VTSVQGRLDELIALIGKGVAASRARISEGLPNAELSEVHSSLETTLTSCRQMIEVPPSNVADLERGVQTSLSELSAIAARYISAAKGYQDAATSMAVSVAKILGGEPLASLRFDELKRLPDELAERVRRVEEQADTAARRIRNDSFEGELEFPPRALESLTVLEAIEQLGALHSAIEVERARLEVAQGSSTAIAKAAAGPKDVAPTPNTPETTAEPLRFHTQANLEGVLSRGLVGKLREDAKRALRSGPFYFLPLSFDESTVLPEAGPGCSAVDATNVTAATLILLWAHELAVSSRPLSQYLEFLSEARKLRESLLRDAATPSFEMRGARLANRLR
jgi:hypothetical protein